MFNNNADQQLDHQIQHHFEDTIQDLRWSDSGKFLATASWAREVAVFEVGQGSNNGVTAQNRLKTNMSAPALSLCWSPDDKMIYSGLADGKLMSIDLSTNQSMQIGVHSEGVTGVEWIPEFNMTASCSLDKTIKFWDGKSPNPTLTLQVGERCNEMRYKATNLCVFHGENSISIYNQQNIQNNNLQPMHKEKSSVTSNGLCMALHCSPTNMMVGLGFHDGKTWIHNPNGAKQNTGGAFGTMGLGGRLGANTKNAFSFKCHRTAKQGLQPHAEVYAVNCLDFHPVKESILVTGGGDCSIGLWDRERLQKVRDFTNLGAPVTKLSIHPSGFALAYAVGYDWSQGWEQNTTNIVAKVFIKCFKDSDFVQTNSMIK